MWGKKLNKTFKKKDKPMEKYIKNINRQLREEKTRMPNKHTKMFISPKRKCQIFRCYFTTIRSAKGKV